MKRYFIFTWHSKKSPLLERRNPIIISNAPDDIGVAAKRATDIFCSNFGSLAKNDIVSIQEIDKDNNPIGEPITPMAGSSIVPIKKS